MPQPAPGFWRAYEKRGHDGVFPVWVFFSLTLGVHKIPLLEYSPITKITPATIARVAADA